MQHLKPRCIETLREWLELEKELIQKQYTLYSFQHDTECEEGFHSWFANQNFQYDLEIMTHNEEVRKSIINYNHK